jgi:hypothetical protein
MKKITSTKTYATMMEHRAAANPNGHYCIKGWANLKFKYPFKRGKASKYLYLLVYIGKTGSTWVNALKELGVKPEKQYSGYFSDYRLSFLYHGLIKKAGRIGREQKYVLTNLGDRYVSMALRRAS